MNFFGKTGFIVSAGMLLAGGILLSIGAANGGIRQVQAMAENGELSIAGAHLFYSDRYHRVATQVADAWVVEEGEWDFYKEPFLEEAISQYEVTDTEWWEYENDLIELAKKDEIQKLSIDWNSHFYIHFIEGDSFYIECFDKQDFYEVKENTLKISSKKGEFSGECILYIPDDWVGKEVDISIGAGSLSFEVLHADKVEVEVGAGYVEGETIIADKFDAEVGSGSFMLNELQTKDAEIEIGLGVAEIMNGTITGDLDVECGMGGLMLYLTGKESDHNYKVSSTGNLNIGTYYHTGFHSDYEINNHVSSDFQINCGLGNIDIYFE